MMATMKKWMVWFSVLCMLFCTIAAPALAEECTAAKTDELINRKENRFEVELKVPGKDGDDRHDEVIIMVDGSYSMDEEWEDMKKAIMLIGETVLNGSGNTQLTVMSFGISPNTVLKHATSVDELAKMLPSKPGGLLYGRSATNCAGAFDGIRSYINNHDEDLKDAFVIFLSDGGANLNSEPVDWIAVSQKISAANAKACQQHELNQVVLGNANISPAFMTVYGDAAEDMIAKWKFVFDQEAVLGELDGKIQAAQAELDAMAETDEGYAEKAAEVADLQAQFDAELAASVEAANAVYAQINSVDETGRTKGQQWVTQVYKDFYAFDGLTEGEKYPVYKAEYAYVDYQKENDLALFDTFYYVLGSSGIAHDNVGGVKGHYAAISAAKTAAMDEISQMYVVRYGTDHRSGWMTSVSGATAVQSPNIAGLCNALQGTLNNLSKTPFNDVVITDYMSKWVNLDASTLKIVDNSNGSVIWTAADGWLTENRPTAQEVPVVVELVDPAEYEAGGADVIGNTSGDIYKLTWYVKDGAMLRSDTYSLKYKVTTDVNEEGFEYGVEYPANGNTVLHYTDENGAEQDEPITVPNVDAPEDQAPPKDKVVSFESGAASHICFLYVDEATGEVIYESKIDFDDNDTSAKIPAKDGFISAVFIKQAKSGIIWTAEEVDEAVMDKIIESVKANDPAYMGHDAIAFGDGAHELTYSQGNKDNAHTVTYFFGDDVVELPTEDKTEESTEDKTEESTEDKTEESTEDKTEESTEDKPEESTEDKTEESTEDKTEESTEDKPEESTEDKNEESTEDKTEGSTEDKTEESAEDKTEESTEDEPTEPAMLEAKVSFKKGEASHIVYMTIDKETGDIVSFAKEDIGSKKTSRKMEYSESEIAVMFIMQAKSGMIWTSEDISDSMLEQIVKVVEDKDSAYNGYDAVADGEGKHDLTYAKNKNKTTTVTYKFAISIISEN